MGFIFIRLLFSIRRESKLVEFSEAFGCAAAVVDPTIDLSEVVDIHRPPLKNLRVVLEKKIRNQVMR